MSYPDYLDIARDGARGWTSFAKYGESTVGTSFLPIASGESVQLPQPAGAQQLQAVSSSADDSQIGPGARCILLRGLDSDGLEISETILLGGLTPTAFTTQSFWRLNFCDVVDSGTYGTASIGSHAGGITVTDGTTAQWAFIGVNGFPHSRWQSSWYTIPKGMVALIPAFSGTTTSNKLADFKILARPNALDDTTTFTPMAELLELTGIGGHFDQVLSFPVGLFPELTDIGAIGRVQQQTGQLSFLLEFAQRTIK